MYCLSIVPPFCIAKSIAISITWVRAEIKQRYAKEQRTSVPWLLLLEIGVVGEPCRAIGLRSGRSKLPLAYSPYVGGEMKIVSRTVGG